MMAVLARRALKTFEHRRLEVQRGKCGPPVWPGPSGRPACGRRTDFTSLVAADRSAWISRSITAEGRLKPRVLTPRQGLVWRCTNPTHYADGLCSAAGCPGQGGGNQRIISLLCTSTL